MTTKGAGDTPPKAAGRRAPKSGVQAKSRAVRSSRKVCQERLACKGNKPEARFECKECGTFQCEVCEELLHENSRFVFHERERLAKAPETSLCQLQACEDPNLADVFCSDCNKKLCFACDSASHSQGSKKRHSRQPFIESTNNVSNQPEQDLESDEFLSCQLLPASGTGTGSASEKPLIDIDLEVEPNNGSNRRPFGGNDKTREQTAMTSGRVNSQPTPTVREKPLRLPDIAQMSLENDANSHPLDDHSGDGFTAVMDLDNISSQLQESFLLINEFESMQISSSEEFAEKLGCASKSSVKVVSIFGNTGEGKSHTMNYTFFGGKEIFKTSPAQSSCTIGIWAAYDPKNKVIVIDTEGLLGVSDNNNRRTRLLLKVLAVSDVIIYRTRAERLHNDLFTFLGDASRAYVHHFSNELRLASQRCSLSGNLSDLGPVVVVFHETLHTDILRTDEDNTPEDELRRRFQSLSLKTEAFSAFEYVGTRTAEPPTCFKRLQKSVKRHLQNSTVRSPRGCGVVFTALKLLNEKFSGDIERSVPSTFPDEYFTCAAQCLSCSVRCTNSMNHHLDGVNHKAAMKCVYQHQYDNRLYFCRACYDRGEESHVVPKTSAANESTWVGLAMYAWSGYVLECDRCGIIYRSRQFWFGNKDPWESTVRTEIQHMWPGELGLGQGTQNAAQKMLDSVNYLSGTVSTIGAKPTRMVSSWVADQIAPNYWIPNSRILHCGKCEKEFEPLEQKHHCRACGGGFCEGCSSKKRFVPERGWGDQEEVRVCDNCYDRQDRGFSGQEQAGPEANSPEVTARKVGEVIHNTLGTVVSAIDYPLAWIKDSARPEYWIPDKDITKCYVCSFDFSEKLAIHHCRACGNGVCDPCSQTKKPVKSRGWDEPVRVCDECDKKANL